MNIHLHVIQTQTENAQQIAELADETPTKKQEVEAQYNELIVLNTEVATLQAQLDAVEQIADLERKYRVECCVPRLYLKA